MAQRGEPSFKVFNELAERYDSWYARHPITDENEAALVEAMTRGLGLQPCVEVGGGTGFFASRLGCLDLDAARAMLEIARRRRGVDAVEADALHLPLRPGSIGLILFIVTLCFLEDPEAALKEAAHALKQGGALLACIVPRRSPWGRFYEERRGSSPFYRVARFLDVEEVEDMMRAAGLVVDSEMGTLSYRPGEPPRPEEPKTLEPEHGFACIRGRKLDKPQAR